VVGVVGIYHEGPVATLITMRRIPSAAVAAMQTQQTTKDHSTDSKCHTAHAVPCLVRRQHNKPCCVVSSGAGEVTSFLLVLSFRTYVAELASHG
jgi:hypothetical protein